MSMSNAPRIQRFLDEETGRRVADHMHASLLREYEEQGLPSPVLTNVYLSDLGSRHPDVISLSAGGQIARPPAPHVIAAVRQAVDEADFHYPGVRGRSELRAALAEKLRRDNGIQADPETHILPVMGAQMVLDAAMRILVNPGDDVLLIEPEYASIEPVIRMAGGGVVRVPLRLDDTGWSFDAEALARAVTPRTRVLVFSNGNNPTGYLYTEEDLQAIRELVLRHDLMVVADEEYEKLVFDGRRHISIASLPEMFERTVTAYSFSKAYCLSGMRIGYLVAPAWFVDHAANYVRFVVQAAGSLAQVAALAVLTGPTEAWLQEALRDLQADRDFAVETINAWPGCRVFPPQGGYFLFVDMRELGIPSWELAEQLLVQERVSVVPGHQFGLLGRFFIRISGCVGRANLEEGLARLGRFLAERGSGRRA